jgi:hypothetical protein
MTVLTYLITALAVVLGIGVAVWSYVDTRRRYYEEYKKRKEK